MPGPKTEAERALDKETQSNNAKIRQSLSNAYASLLAEQTTASFSAFTWEEAMDLQLERIEGETLSQLRPNLLERVDRIEGQLLDAVNQAKEIEVDKFIETDESDDVNTPNEPSD